MATPAPTLIGTRVVLRAPRATDIAARQKLGWHHQIELGYGTSRQDASASHHDAEEWFRYVSEELPGETSWVIEVEGALAGIANLHHLSGPDRNAMFAIGMLSPAYIGHGLGVESSRLVLRHAFTTLGLHRIWLRVLSNNARAIRCYEACGFVYEGTQRETCLLDGTWLDDHFFGLLDREFLAAEHTT
jgi:[ribosomal protein S5]-alanine N-acetyltransferase